MSAGNIVVSSQTPVKVGDHVVRVFFKIGIMVSGNEGPLMITCLSNCSVRGTYVFIYMVGRDTIISITSHTISITSHASQCDTSQNKTVTKQLANTVRAAGLHLGRVSFVINDNSRSNDLEEVSEYLVLCK